MRASRANILIAVLTLITVLAWAGFEIWRAYRTSTVTTETAETIVPLDPTLNEDIFRELEKRQR